MADIARLLRPSLGIGDHRQVPAHPHRVHVFEELRPMPAEQVLRVVLRGHQQQVDPGRIHQPVQQGGVEWWAGTRAVGGHGAALLFGCRSFTPRRAARPVAPASRPFRAGLLKTRTFGDPRPGYVSTARAALDEDLERVKGIEPSYAAWEAAVLPLNYTRAGVCLY